ncbi:hypothetical protein VspSTUT11_07760 [Vibrio sp. STUT-A11]|nr:hypothetical protein VspSTUT11_07760 [Vibrio sp. STUT-A11]
MMLNQTFRNDVSTNLLEPDCNAVERQVFCEYSLKKRLNRPIFHAHPYLFLPVYWVVKFIRAMENRAANGPN